MTKSGNNSNTSSGFTASIAVVLISIGTLAVSLSAVSASFLWSDLVLHKEYRIQARLNLDACLDTMKLKLASNYFLNGTTTLAEFGCFATSTNDFTGNIHTSARAYFNGVLVEGERIFRIADDGVR